MAWDPGKTLYGNRYTIEAEIGKGGFGVTYRARDRRGTPWVIKTLNDDMQRSPDFEKIQGDLQQEALKLAICCRSCPHIVNLENTFTEEGLFYMVMEHIVGEDLWRRINRQGKLSEEEALRYIWQIANALTVIHEKGLLHRDVKPHNIMVRQHEPEAILIDFGLVREFVPEITQHHTAYLTHGFAPIEQYHEEEKRGEYTDVYGIAATLYYLLTKKVPVPAFMRNPKDKLVPPQQVDRRISDRVNHAILKGMALWAADRPQTVEQWLDLLPSVGIASSVPALRSFSFDIITVDDTGKEVNRQRRQARYLTEDLGNGILLEMVSIPGGTFLMGSPETEKQRFDSESPQHRVNVPSFFMGKYPITQAQWQAVMGNNPSYFKGENLPVEHVSWHDAVEFCNTLSQKTGLAYRLPSEAEWEYACRAGTTTPFYFGETITTELANYDGNNIYANGPKGQCREKTTSVGSFPPNAFGLYDMHGNVWEWCQDVWHENYQGAPSDGSAWESGGDNKYRSLRGGSWFGNPWGCRAAQRLRYEPVYRGRYLGFRVCFSCSQAP